MLPFEIQKAKIFASYTEDNDILKGGEGSKGGKVIGHTRSGKAIYDKFNHASHSNYNVDDHFDAANLHRDNASSLLKKRERTKNEDNKNNLMDQAVDALKNEIAHNGIVQKNYKEDKEAAYKKLEKELQDEDDAKKNKSIPVEEEDDDDEEVYQRKQKEKRDKENEGKFMYDDILKLKSPHVDFTTDVSFRGYFGDKAVVYDKKNGSQFTVPKEWLKK